ncbi:DNA-binding response regulator [Friedmanniella luteola]|uniref:DNA-binding response regulator n=1 Tax=Friedmanniella luteola TaxID=546871 RepID=UPI0012FD64AD|nr:DNA-binding response regulator [Friedmanniella luteola]
MRPQLAISDPLPVYRLGVAAALVDFGASVDTPSDLHSWCLDVPDRLAVLTVLTNQHWLLLEELGRLPHVSVIAVLADSNADAEFRAFNAGAVGVVRRDAEPEEFRRIVAAILEGCATIPVPVLRRLISQEPNVSGAPTSSELAWLSALAAGATVSDVAHRAGYSERMMFRLLAEVYRKLGTSRRIDAVMTAKKLGLIE